MESFKSQVEGLVIQLFAAECGIITELGTTSKCHDLIPVCETTERIV